MRLKICLAFLWCLAAVVIVQSETTIEVDENGDEYEVKRFNIEGRQLNGGRSQCVMTRRKRSSAASSEEIAAPDANTDNSRISNSSTNRKGGEDITTSETTPSTGIDLNTKDDADDSNGEDDDDDFDGDDDEATQPINDGQMENSGGNQDGDNQAGDDDYDYGDDSEQNVQMPIIVKKPENHAQITNQVATENLNANGIVVFESNEPPQVDPNTHAVFQLLPVNHALHAAANIEEDDGHLHFEEEISPISTTAIWSTGADDDRLGDLYDDYDVDKEDVDDSDINDDKDKDKDKDKPSKGNKKPAKKPSKKPGKKPGKKPNKRPSKKPSRGGNKRKGSKKTKKGNKKPMRKRRRPGQKNKRPMNGNRRGNKKKKNGFRRPYRPNIRRGSNFNRNTAMRKKNKNNRFNNNSNRRFNSDLSNRDIKRRRQNNDFVKDKGTRTFTKTETMTQTGTANDQKDLNCIIIRKDPPPTTARPFWNILGRNADDTGRSAHFGNRKRINLRFSSKKE